MSVEENKAIARRWYEYWNRGDMDALFALHDDNLMDHNAPPGIPPGNEGAKIFLGAFRAAFPDLHITLEQVIGEGDKVMVHGTARGTHKGDLFGIPATTKPVEFTFSDLYRIADGKMMEVWHIEDLVTVMQQIGVMPAPGGTAQA